MSRAKEFLNEAQRAKELRSEQRYFYGSDDEKFLSNFLKVWKKIAGVVIISAAVYGVATSEFVTGLKDSEYQNALLGARLALKADTLDKSIYPTLPNPSEIGDKLDKNASNLMRIDQLMKTGELQNAIENATGKFKVLLERNGFSLDRDGENKGSDHEIYNKYKDMRAKKREEALREYLSRNPSLAENVVNHFDENKPKESQPSENKQVKTENQQSDINALKKKLGM